MELGAPLFLCMHQYCSRTTHRLHNHNSVSAPVRPYYCHCNRDSNCDCTALRLPPRLLLLLPLRLHLRLLLLLLLLYCHGVI